jgi:hypothetical protein
MVCLVFVMKTVQDSFYWQIVNALAGGMSEELS